MAKRGRPATVNMGSGVSTFAIQVSNETRLKLEKLAKTPYGELSLGQVIRAILEEALKGK